MYEWLKAFHLIAVIFWMAGLLYLPRLFVYHSASKPGGELEAKMIENIHKTAVLPRLFLFLLLD